MGMYDGLQELPTQTTALPPPPAAPRPPAGMYDGLEVLRPKEAVGTIEAFQAGVQSSVLGMAWRGKLPDLVINPKTAKWWETVAQGVGAIGPDILPIMMPAGIAGTAAGTAVGGPVGGILGGGAAMFGVEDGIRESLIQAYSSGEIKTAVDWFNVVREVAMATGKGAAVGAVTMGAGSAAARVVGKAIAPAIGEAITAKTGMAVIGAVDTAAQIAGMTTMPDALQGQLPDLAEFGHAAGIILALKGIHAAADRVGFTRATQRIANVYLKTGRTPAQQVADAKADPTITDELIKPPETEVAPLPGQLSKQEELFSIQGRLGELEAKTKGTPAVKTVDDYGNEVTIPAKQPEYFTAAEKAEFDSLKAKSAALEAEGVKPEVPRGTVPSFTSGQLVEAKDRAAQRIAELTTKEGTGPLTDMERAERIGLVNALDKPEILAKRFGLEPAIKAITDAERQASAERVAEEVRRQAKEADMARAVPLGDEHVDTITQLVLARVKTRAARLGILPEELYAERPIRIRDEAQAEIEAEQAAIPPEAPRFTPPEVDLFGNPIAPETAPRAGVADLATQEVPIAGLKLSKEVPQFKKDANAEGVIVPLGGKFDRTGVGPIQVWERLDGSMEVISGRHRLDLARRSGEETIPAQIHREADGFTAKQAATLDAQLNIREEQGSGADFAQYFRDSGISEQTANELGLLARAKGRGGFAIARDASPDLLAAHRAGLLSDDAALSISQTAPGSERLQALGIAMVNDGKSTLYATNMMRSIDLMASERMAAGAQGDIFGFDDSAMREAAAMAKKASSKQRAISEQISAVSGASRRPELARKMGVDVQDPEGIQKKIAELKQEQYQWDNWPLYPELVAKLRAAPITAKTEEQQSQPNTGKASSPATEIAPAPQPSLSWFRDHAPLGEVALNEQIREYYSANKDVKAYDVLSDGEYVFFKQPDGSYATVPDIAKANPGDYLAVGSIFEVQKIVKAAGAQMSEVLLPGNQIAELRKISPTETLPGSDQNILHQDARAFWEKMGTQLIETKEKTDGVLTRAAFDAARPSTKIRTDARRDNGDPSVSGDVGRKDGRGDQNNEGGKGGGTLYQDDFELRAETPAELKARDEEAAAAAKRKLAQERAGVKGPVPTVDQADLFNTQRTLFQTTREKQKLDAIMEEYGTDRIKGQKNSRMDFNTVERMAEDKNPDAGAAALISYVTDDFSRFTDDYKHLNKATKVLVDYVDKMEPTQTGTLYRVLGFENDAFRNAFLKRIKKGEGATLQSERPLMSFTEQSPEGETPMSHIGLDVATQFGDRYAVIEVRPKDGQSRLDIGRDISSLYGATSKNLELLVPRDTLFKLKEITQRDGHDWIVLEPLKTSTKPRVLFQDKDKPWYYSELARSVEASPMKQGTAKAWQDYIKSRVGKGVKPEEIEATGINDWLATQDGKVTKEQVQAFMEQGGVKVTETMLGESHNPYDAFVTKMEEKYGEGYDTQALTPAERTEQGRLWDLTQQRGGMTENHTKFQDYQEPGAVPGSYRELVLTLPEKPSGYRAAQDKGNWWRIQRPDGTFVSGERFGSEAEAAARLPEYARSAVGDNRSGNFESSHFPGSDYLAHTRVNDRVLPDGRKVLFVEEIQSDRAQKGRTDGFRKAWPEDEIAKFKVLNRDPEPPKDLKQHSMWSKGDYFYLRDKGYSDAEVRAFWDRDAAAGKGPAKQSDYMRQRAKNRDWIVVDGEGNELARPPGHLNDTAEDALRVVQKGAREGTLNQMGKIAPAPFVTKTDSWTALVLKRLLRYAAEGNYDAIAWTRGEQQVERYTSALRKAVDTIEWKKTPEGVQIVGYKGRTPQMAAKEKATALHQLDSVNEQLRRIKEEHPTITAGVQGIEPYVVEGWTRLIQQREGLKAQIAGPDYTNKVVDTTEKESALSDAIGKSMADRIRNDPNQTGTIEGENITVSDTGMAGYYDKIVPKLANEISKKLGGDKVGEITIEMPAKESDPDAIVRTVAGRDVADQKQQMLPITPAMREKIMAGQALFQNKGQDRGDQHLGSYAIAENLITTFRNANKSTVVHELSHSWLEEMKADAARPDAPAQIKADWEIIRREFAIGEGGDITTASHEQFARTAERYYGEGKAPSVGLRAVFERFKAWMLEIYANLQNIGSEINPEIRGMFDRMLATDQEIADAKAMDVPRVYVPEARATEAARIVQPIEERRKIEPGFEAEKASMEPYADELPPGPGEAPDSSHINYAYINAPRDVQLAMQKMAEIDQANIQKHRGGKEGVKSWAESNAEQARYINDILGGSPDTLKLFTPKDPSAPGPDVRLGALKKLAVGAAKDSARLRDVVLEAGHDATIRQQLEYMGSIERARMIQAEFLGERADVARALNALKDVTEGTGEIAKMLDAIGYGEAAKRELYQDKRTPAEEQDYLKAKLDEIMLNYRGKSVLDIAKLHKEIGTLKGSYGFSKKVTEATTWEMLVEGWKSFILSGPVTHTTNFFGTEAFHWVQPAVDALAATIGMARGASPGMGETDRASMSEAIARITGMVGGVKDGAKVFAAMMKSGEGTGKTESYRQAIPGRLGHVIRTPLRLMGAEDGMVSTMYMRGELGTMAIRQAFDEQLNPSTREFSERVQALINNPPAAMLERAQTQATRMTFNEPYGEKGRALVNFINKWNLQWMIPFTRTPINIALEMFRLSPFAPGVAAWRADFAKGGAARDRALAEMALGTGIATLTMALAFSRDDKGRKILTGSGDPDPGKYRAKEGVEPSTSMLIDGTYYDYSRIQPIGTLMGMASDMAAVWEHMTPEEKDKVPKMLARAFANGITNQTFLQGITNFINAVSDPGRFAPRFIQQFASSAVPNIIAQPTGLADPQMREINGTIEAIMARLPGFRDQLLPKRDWLGEPRKPAERIGVIMPVRKLTPSEDAVRQEAVKLGISVGTTPKRIHLGTGTGKMGYVDLTPEEHDTFAKISGEFAHQKLAELIASPNYAAMPDYIKKKVFHQILSIGNVVAAAQALPIEKRNAYMQTIAGKMEEALGAPAK